MASTDPKFACPACGKQYKWKPEMAGRTGKCGCGAKLVVPTTAPVAMPTNEPAMAGVKCPGCGTALPPGAVLCVNCGYNLKTGQTLSVVVETGDAGADDTGTPISDKGSARQKPRT